MSLQEGNSNSKKVVTQISASPQKQNASGSPHVFLVDSPGPSCTSFFPKVSNTSETQTPKNIWKTTTHDPFPLEDWASFPNWCAGWICFMFLLDSILTSHCGWSCADSLWFGLTLPRPHPRDSPEQLTLRKRPPRFRVSPQRWAEQEVGQGWALKVDLPWGPSLGVHTPPSPAASGSHLVLWLLCDFRRTKEPSLTASSWPPGFEHTLLHLAHSRQAHHRLTPIHPSVSRWSSGLRPHRDLPCCPINSFLEHPFIRTCSEPGSRIRARPGDTTQCQALVRHLVNICWIKGRNYPATTPPVEDSYVLPGLIWSIVTALYLNRKTITRRGNQRRGNSMKYRYKPWLWKQIIMVQCPVLPPANNMTVEKSRNHFFSPSFVKWG